MKTSRLLLIGALFAALAAAGFAATHSPAVQPQATDCCDGGACCTGAGCCH